MTDDARRRFRLEGGPVDGFTVRASSSARIFVFTNTDVDRYSRCEYMPLPDGTATFIREDAVLDEDVGCPYVERSLYEDEDD